MRTVIEMNHAEYRMFKIFAVGMLKTEMKDKDLSAGDIFDRVIMSLRTHEIVDIRMRD
jgi:hypothetical protein